MEKKFKTSNITLTAFLLTQGISLINIVEEYRQSVFLLSNPEKCELLRRNYLNNASAPAQELFSKREMLITEIKGKNSPNINKVVKGSSVTSVQATLNKTEQSERQPTEATDIPIINN